MLAELGRWMSCGGSQAALRGDVLHVTCQAASTFAEERTLEVMARYRIVTVTVWSRRNGENGRPNAYSCAMGRARIALLPHATYAHAWCRCDDAGSCHNGRVAAEMLHAVRDERRQGDGPG